MKKNLGIIIAFIGILIVVSALILTPSHSLNPVDSTNGIDASASEFFGGLIIFGAGIVILANANASESEKHIG